MSRNDRGSGAFALCGVVFTSVGSLFVILGAWMCLNMDFVASHGTGSVEMLPVMFVGLGSVFGVLGAVVLRGVTRRRAEIRRLLDAGEFVQARVVEVFDDDSVRVNRRPGVRVRCVHADPLSGEEREFVSDPLFSREPRAGFGETVRVYVSSRGRSHVYYVDV